MSATTQVLSPTGDDIIRLAQQHVGQKYVLGVTVPKNDGRWPGPWDCAEFASWVVYQCAGILYGCANNSGNPAVANAYTGFWERDVTTLGQSIPISQAAGTAGAFVLRVPHYPAIGHIVISDGRGGTIEAHSSADGVIASTLSNRHWDLGILVPGITYTANPPVVVPGPTILIYRIRTPFMKGDKVREIQQKLQAVGCDPGAIDGIFGPRTHTAVVAFQLGHNLVADGEVGPYTAAALGIQF